VGSRPAALLPPSDPVNLVHQLVLGRIRPEEAVGGGPDQRLQISLAELRWMVRELDEQLRDGHLG
jgi:hypothetical protein